MYLFYAGDDSMSASKRRPPGDGFSRRAFLKGSGAVAAAVAAGRAVAEEPQADPSTEVVSGSTELELTVNGEKHKVQVEPRTTLLEVLRYQLNLTGAKPVSLDGSSGASTVLVDDRPVMASTTLAIACRGKTVKTVEALADDAVPRAFTEHDAQQCGFCTPGFVVAVRAFLDKHPQATREEIRAGLNGNICRCGTYANVLEAVVAMVKGEGNG